MKMLALCLAIASCGSGTVAAYYWYRSATVPVMPTWMGGDRPDPMNEPVIKSLSQDGWIAGTVKAAIDSAYWNRRGALWSAASVLLGGIASVVNAQL